MLAPVATSPELITGQRLTVGEFLLRWEEQPGLKNAELIDGVVYVSSPVSFEHGRSDFQVHLWLGHYAQATPGCEGGTNSAWLMMDSAPQPDVFLRILPSYGGQSAGERQYCIGAPELAVEICATSTDLDFGPKLALYQRAGVREYITIEVFSQRIVWRVLQDGAYVAQPIGQDGIMRSQVFPGLWLDVAAFTANDGAKLLATLNAGLATPDHQHFVERLAAAKSA